MKPEERKYLAILRLLHTAAESGDANAGSILARLNDLDEEQIRLKKACIAHYERKRVTRQEHAECYRQCKAMIDRLISIRSERRSIIRVLRSNNLPAVSLSMIRRKSSGKKIKNSKT